MVLKEVPMVVYPDPRKLSSALGTGAAPAAPQRLRPIVFPKDDMSRLRAVQNPGALPAAALLSAAAVAGVAAASPAWSSHPSLAARHQCWVHFWTVRALVFSTTHTAGRQR